MTLRPSLFWVPDLGPGNKGQPSNDMATKRVWRPLVCQPCHVNRATLWVQHRSEGYWLQSFHLFVQATPVPHLARASLGWLSGQAGKGLTAALPGHTPGGPSRQMGGGRVPPSRFHWGHWAALRGGLSLGHPWLRELGTEAGSWADAEDVSFHSRSPQHALPRFPGAAGQRQGTRSRSGERSVSVHLQSSRALTDFSHVGVCVSAGHRLSPAGPDWPAGPAPPPALVPWPLAQSLPLREHVTLSEQAVKVGMSFIKFITAGETLTGANWVFPISKPLKFDRVCELNKG